MPTTPTHPIPARHGDGVGLLGWGAADVVVVMLLRRVFGGCRGAAVSVAVGRVVRVGQAVLGQAHCHPRRGWRWSFISMMMKRLMLSS